MKKKRELIYLVILVIIGIGINYNYLDGFIIKNFSNEEYIEVERVIDGDTVVVNGTSVRLLGINAPEKGEKYYAEAKNYTSSLVMDRSLRTERKGKDLYGRELAYLFYGNININSEIVKKGYANYYFPEGKDNYYDLFVNSWEDCIKRNENLCEKSESLCAECIVLKDFGYNQNVILYNKCLSDCNLEEWSIKDEGRKKFVFENFILISYAEAEISNKDFNETYVWTKTGDT